MIDDYHNIHSIKRPQNENSSHKVDDMCTIIIKIIKGAPVVEFSSVNLVQNLNGIDVDLLISKFCYVEFLVRCAIFFLPQQCQNLSVFSLIQSWAGNKWRPITIRDLVH